MRNEERLGARHQSDEPIPTQQPEERSNTLVIPTATEIVALPSEGKYYPEGHPLHNKAEIEIKYLTAKEEDILTNKSYLKKGIAVEKMLQSIILDKNIKIDDLLIGDKNALSVAARVVGYGSDYTAKIPCVYCNEPFEASFDLEQARETKKDAPKEVIFTDNNTVLISLPKTKAKVECRFITGEDEKRLAFLQEKNKKHNLPDVGLTDQMKLFVVSINGVNDKEQISRFIDNMPAIDAKWLRTLYKKAAPNVKMVYTVECSECERKQEVELPFTAQFFWPK